MNRDLTVGKPEAVLWRFCMPLFGSIIFQQLYNIADSLVAGKFIGENALAAVGNSYEITLIFIAFAFGCNMGCPFSVVVLGNFRRFLLVIFYFFSCISIFPLFTANFQCPFGAFFIEKIFLIYYNNSTL